MFQKFYEDTLMGRFIKRLLRSTNLPLLSIIQHNDYIVQGCQYIFKGYIIQALTSGQFCIDPDKHFGPGIYNTGNKTVIIDGESCPVASYKVICQYDENNKQHSYNFHSRFMYYDPETHYELGQYLRYLQDTTGLNLLPYYNCYFGKSIDEVILTNTKKVEVGKNSSKVLLVPVKYGKTYTIALECNTPIIIQPIVYHSDAGLVITNYTNTVAPDYYSNHTYLRNTQKILSSSSFLKPFTFDIPNAPDKKYYQQERNLYLAIQVPLEVDSGLVVLEGCYINTWGNNGEKRHITSLAPDARNEGDTLDPVMIQNLTLLHFDSKANIAFSDRLIEYLLLNVINDTETLDGNIEYVQGLLSKVTNNDFYTIKGVWDNRIREELYRYTNTTSAINTLRDLDGYLNKDLEARLQEIE